MMHTNTGAVIFGSGVYPTSISRSSDRLPLPPKDDIFATEAGDWRESTLGEIANRYPDHNKPGWMAVIAAAELASFILFNVRGAENMTPCKLGFASRRKAIIVGGREYSAVDGMLHSREVK